MRRIKKLIARLMKSRRDPLKIAQKFRDYGVKIGENTYIYSSVRLGLGGRDPIEIGSNCVLTGCTVLGHDASTNYALGITKSPQMLTVIEDECFIGYGAIILMGVTVGKGSIVAAGAIVSKDVEPGTVVAGNPAKPITQTSVLVEKRRELAKTHPEYFREMPK
jgi:acetyltransferase-like isoleucine patch superfamily enzyme